MAACLSRSRAAGGGSRPLPSPQGGRRAASRPPPALHCYNESRAMIMCRVLYGMLTSIFKSRETVAHEVAAMERLVRLKTMQMERAKAGRVRIIPVVVDDDTPKEQIEREFRQRVEEAGGQVILFSDVDTPKETDEILSPFSEIEGPNKKKRKKQKPPKRG